jgi:DNA-binding transcriptional ArsR family regulator
MAELRFAAHDVANVRFAVSPLWETVASLQAVADPGRHVVHLPWIRRALALTEGRALAGRIAPLAALSPRPEQATGFLTPPPRCPLAEFEEELGFLLATPAERIRDALAATGGQAPPSPFERRLAEDPARVLPELADAVRAWWEAAIRPHWPRIRAVLEADIAHRTRTLAADGIQQMFAELHPALRWAGDRLVTAELPAERIDLGGAGITLTPSAFSGRWYLPRHQDGTPGVVYPARAVGTLWERRTAAGHGLARLLGRSRAQLLGYTSSPATTTQLAARTGLSLGAVSQHLAVLRDAGLVTSHRYRREVNYTVSDLGAELLRRC